MSWSHRQKNTLGLCPVLYKRIDGFELSQRVLACLARAEIECIGQLIQLHERDLSRTERFGRKSINELKDDLLDVLMTEDGESLMLGMEVTQEVKDTFPLPEFYRAMHERDRAKKLRQ